MKVESLCVYNITFHIMHQLNFLRILQPLLDLFDIFLHSYLESMMNIAAWTVVCFVVVDITSTCMVCVTQVDTVWVVLAVSCLVAWVWKMTSFIVREKRENTSESFKSRLERQYNQKKRWRCITKFIVKLFTDPPIPFEFPKVNIQFEKERRWWSSDGSWIWSTWND